MKENKLNVGLVFGGRSVEHDISILSGLQAYHAIDKNKYNVTCFYINKNNEWLVGPSLKDINTYIQEDFSKCNVVTLYGEEGNVFYRGIFNKPKNTPIDVFLLILHGEGSEGGTIQGYLDTIGAAYTSSNLQGSVIIQDKIYTKQILKYEDIPFIPYDVITKKDVIDLKIEKIEETLNYPLIIKPSKLGSSIGISCASNTKELLSAVLEAFKYDDRVIVEEKLVDFKEYNIAILKDTNKLISSAIEEVFPTSDILSFTDKYENMGKLSESSNRIIPAILNTELEQKIKEYAIKIFQTLDLSGVVRIDFLFDSNENKLFVNEINNIPGSLAFYLFEKVNLSFTNLIDILIKNAIIQKNQNQRLIKTFRSSVLSKKGSKLVK